jgi:hypothetical protein
VLGRVRPGVASFSRGQFEFAAGCWVLGAGPFLTEGMLLIS